MRFAPWRPVKLAVKLTAACAAGLGLAYYWYREPSAP